MTERRKPGRFPGDIERQLDTAQVDLANASLKRQEAEAEQVAVDEKNADSVIAVISTLSGEKRFVFLKNLAQDWALKERFGVNYGGVLTVLRRKDSNLADELSAELQRARDAEIKKDGGGPLPPEAADNPALAAVAKARDRAIAAEGAKSVNVRKLADALMSAWETVQHAPESVIDERTREWARMMVETEKFGADNSSVIGYVRGQDEELADILLTHMASERAKEKKNKN